MSRICDAFGVLPTVAVKEWRRAPELVLRVLEAKSYAHWFHVLMTATDEKAFPPEGQEPMFDMACELHAEYLQAQRERIRTR